MRTGVRPRSARAAGRGDLRASHGALRRRHALLVVAQRVAPSGRRLVPARLRSGRLDAMIDASLREDVGTPPLAVMLLRPAMRPLQLTSPDPLSVAIAPGVTIALLPYERLAGWRPPRSACIADEAWPFARVRLSTRRRVPIVTAGRVQWLLVAATVLGVRVASRRSIRKRLLPPPAKQSIRHVRPMAVAPAPLRQFAVRAPLTRGMAVLMALAVGVPLPIVLCVGVAALPVARMPLVQRLAGEVLGPCVTRGPARSATAVRVVIKPASNIGSDSRVIRGGGSGGSGGSGSGRRSARHDELFVVHDHPGEGKRG